jgi:hypothetical protein
MMSDERAKRLREWHDDAYADQRASLPLRLSFMGLDLHVSDEVYAPPGPEEGHPFH